MKRLSLASIRSTYSEKEKIKKERERINTAVGSLRKENSESSLKLVAEAVVMRKNLSKSADNSFVLSRSESFKKSNDLMKEDDKLREEITEKMLSQRNSLKLQIQEKLDRRRHKAAKNNSRVDMTKEL